MFLERTCRILSHPIGATAWTLVTDPVVADKTGKTPAAPFLWLPFFSPHVTQPQPWLIVEAAVSTLLALTHSCLLEALAPSAPSAGEVRRRFSLFSSLESHHPSTMYWPNYH